MKKYCSVLLVLLLIGCATPNGTNQFMKSIQAADVAYDAALSGCASAYAAKLITDAGKSKCIELGNYYVYARTQALKAYDVWLVSKDKTDLEKIWYWLVYAEGVLAQIVIEQSRYKAVT